MKSFRAHWTGDAQDPALSAPRLYAVGRSAPPRPRWCLLYVASISIGVIGTGAHLLVHDVLLLALVDVVFPFVLFAAIGTWVHLNRIALSRLDEPAAGTGKPAIRMIRPRPHRARGMDDRIVRLDPDERIVLPYDFR
jgi:hypothetical protein